MAYYKQSFDEAQGNTLALDAYRDRKAELAKLLPNTQQPTPNTK